MLCTGTGCVSNHAFEIKEAFEKEIVKRELQAEALVVPTGCNGFCAHGPIVVIEPDGLATDGSFVLAHCDGEWVMRQLCRHGERWRLQALNPAYPAAELADLSNVRGVIIQKSRPGRRRASKRYVD